MTEQRLRDPARQLDPITLAHMLEFGGFIPRGAHHAPAPMCDDPHVMEKVGYLCGLINAATHPKIAP